MTDEENWVAYTQKRMWVAKMHPYYELSKKQNNTCN